MTKPESNNNIDYNSNYRLSVQVSLNGLSFLILDDASSVTHFKKEIDFPESHNPDEVLSKIESTFNQFEELLMPLKDVTVIHQNTLFSLVPKAIFQEDNLEHYLKLNTRVFPTDFIAYDRPDNLDFVLVYVPLTNVNNYFFDRYGGFTYLHSSTVFIEKMLLKERNDQSLKLFVKLNKEQMDVLVTSGKNIQLFNSFHYSTPEDFIYYILFIAEQLQLNPETIPLQLSGNVSEKDAYFDMAYTYIRNVTIEKENNPNTLQIV